MICKELQTPHNAYTITGSAVDVSDLRIVYEFVVISLVYWSQVDCDGIH